jgi:penicillin-binding protein activator
MLESALARKRFWPARAVLEKGDEMISLSRSWPLALLPLMTAALLAAGCAEKTRYGDAKGVETVTNQFGSTDLQMIAESMTRSLLNSEVVSNGSRPVITVQEVRNKTSEYIDTRAITDSIRTELQKSGRVRFAVDAAAMQEQVDELHRQQSELYEKNKSAQIGKMVGAVYRIEGNIVSIVKDAKNVKDVYYKFNLQLWNIDNGLMEWGDEKEIRKTTTRS